jgi:putative serine protease PepD
MSTEQAPWWIPADGSSPRYSAASAPRTAMKKGGLFAGNVSLRLALLMSLIAAVVGSVVARGSLAFSGGGSIVSSHSTIERAPDSIAGIAARVSPSVVSINVSGAAGSDTGSGFFIRKDGFILTNNHVIENALNGGSVSVALANGKNYDAKIVGRDSAYDLAVLKIAIVDAPALQLGNSDAVQVGDGVIAIGSPLGLAGTVTSGILSAKNRPVTSGNAMGESSFINALQTDAAINPGNSGGPLVDMTGAVIGVNSAIASLGSNFGGQAGSIGLGFAIPINQAKRTADALIATGKSTYPIIGLSLDRTFTGVGAKVANTPTAVLPGGPADKAGLKGGDLITDIDGNPVANADEAIVAIRSHQVGDSVKVTYHRGTSTRVVTLVLIAATK